jgi:hypothetical protein
MEVRTGTQGEVDMPWQHQHLHETGMADITR